MGKIYALYNAYSNNGKGYESAKGITKFYPNEELCYIDITKINSYKIFLDGIKSEDKIVICGGDGTLNKFINSTKDIVIDKDIYYFPTGTGNDFYKEISNNDENKVVKMNKYLNDLPTVTVKKKTYKFLNGVGYGIDGYCCEIGDKHKKESTKKINYTKIAIKGLLFDFKPTNAHIVVDGEKYYYEKVWLAPTMKGLYYGGGMMPTPNQKREENAVTLMLFHGSNKLQTLMIFPSIFSGKHVNKIKNVKIFKGKDIKVMFDEPRTLQIDGETILDVLEYHVTVN